MTATIRTVLWALLAAALTAAVLILIFAFWAYKSEDPLSLVGIFGMIIFFVSCFAGGIVSRRGEGNILTGIIFSIAFVLICFGLSLIFEGEQNMGRVFLTYLGGAGCALLGGIIFGGKRVKKPKALKKYSKLKRK